MNIDQKILSSAEELFNSNGFNATGVDSLSRAADVSSRTLYKHVGSKIGLINEVLKSRDARFSAQFDPAVLKSVTQMFDVLQTWHQKHGYQGCLFLRATGEGIDSDSAVADTIRKHKASVADTIRRLVKREIGDQEDISDQILVLFEGATAAAVYRGSVAISEARNAALTLLTAASRR